MPHIRSFMGSLGALDHESDLPMSRARSMMYLGVDGEREAPAGYPFTSLGGEGLHSSHHGSMTDLAGMNAMPHSYTVGDLNGGRPEYSRETMFGRSPAVPVSTGASAVNLAGAIPTASTSVPTSVPASTAIPTAIPTAVPTAIPTVPAGSSTTTPATDMVNLKGSVNPTPTSTPAASTTLPTSAAMPSSLPSSPATSASSASTGRTGSAGGVGGNDVNTGMNMGMNNSMIDRDGDRGSPLPEWRQHVSASPHPQLTDNHHAMTDRSRSPHSPRPEDENERKNHGKYRFPCRDFEKGVCSRGAACKFYHDPAKGMY